MNVLRNGSNVSLGNGVCVRALFKTISPKLLLAKHPCYLATHIDVTDFTK